MASYQPLAPVYDGLQPTHELLPMATYDTDEYYNERPPSRASSQAPLREEASADTTYKGYADDIEHETNFRQGPFRLYKRRFIGLAQLTLVNLILAWGSGTFGSIADSAAEYFNVSVNTINWLGTAGSLAFLPTAPLAVWILNKSGPKMAIIIASALVLTGNWIRYAGTRTASFRTVMVGQVILSFAQPFVLCAPTRYSKLWFSDRGRTSATAVASLSSALGAVIGGLVGPQLAEASNISGLVLYTSIISSVACIPAPFVPKAPPTPPSAFAAAPVLGLRKSLGTLLRNKPFYLMFASFTIFVAAFQTSANLVVQMLQPYGFSEVQAGIASSVMVFVGIIAAAIASPILDRLQNHMLAVKCLTPVIAGSYLILIFIPQTHSVAGIYVIFAVIGAASFSITPGTLEFQAAWTHPVSPEVSSTICWSGGQLFTAIFIIVMDSLVNKKTWHGQPPGSLAKGLVFQAAMTVLCVPLTLLTGRWIFKRPAASITHL
ncbi:hypothetical protein LTR36_000618 [Oleoguttula mirabilis]|uniref:MFS general substrate transporter n=1 Tax=Oleoguttula mirabilis TaxID=1507867 RepID=A0AAV9JPX5_9PEZI|nr:hypothetical protein LTR36_000618 [Oleoguttula mirabilis]